MILKVTFRVLIFCLLQDLISIDGVNGQAQCSPTPVNLAVYEGTQDTMMICGLNPNAVSYKIKPASDPLPIYTLTNYSTVVSQPLLYSVNQTGLLIKTAQGNNATVSNISTAGLYVMFNTSNSAMIGAKLIVVRAPPTCGCNPLNYTAFSLTCSLTYADVPIEPCNAKFTWNKNGAPVRTDTPVRTQTKAPYFTSTATYIVSTSDTSSYTCTVTFSNKTSPQFAFTVVAGPKFSASCSPPASCLVTTTQTETTSVTTTSMIFGGPTSNQQPTTTPPMISTTESVSNRSTCDVCTTTSATPAATTAHSKQDGADLTDIYDECVVKAELYATCSNCCPDNLVCGVVVTIRDDTRWLIYDSVCDDNRCEMVAVDAACMSSEWKLLAERKVIKSGVGDYVKSGNSCQIDSNLIDCSDSCKRMMNLP